MDIANVQQTASTALQTFIQKLNPETFTLSTLKDPSVLIPIIALFLGILVVCLVLQKAFSAREMVSFVPGESSDRLSVVEALVNDIRSKHAEQLTKLQGEILYLRHELESLREGTDRVLGLVEEPSRRSSRI